MAASFKLRLITAQRGVEVLMMRWEDIDGEWWTIPAEVAKNGRSHRVPLSAPALALLEELREAAKESRWVFPSPKGGDRPIGYVQKAADRLAELAGVAFVPHDLRRTAASAMTSMGVPRLVVSKILNHVESGVTAIYDRHSYDAEKREALGKWGERVEAMLSTVVTALPHYDPLPIEPQEAVAREQLAPGQPKFLEHSDSDLLAEG
jgi:integrase